MPRIFAVFAISFGSLGCVLAASGCSSGSSANVPSADDGGGSGGNGGTADGGCAYNAGADLMTPSVSFTNDVRPLLRQSCAFGGSCHGNISVMSQGRPYFGDPDGGVAASTIVAGLVGKASSEDPKMELVKAGDPGNSYFVHKVIGDQGMFAADCADAGSSSSPACGTRMPYMGPCWAASSIDTVRRWIAQGAMNN